MTESGKEWIVAAVDGSDHSKQALTWALRQASLTGATVEAVAVWQIPALAGPAALTLPPDSLDFEKDTKQMLDETVAEVAGRDTKLDVVQSVHHGNPAAELIRLSKTADLVVLGSRGHGEFAGMLIGSVSQHVVTHAHCPVVVVRSKD